jgi:hypothetical protein
MSEVQVSSDHHSDSDVRFELHVTLPNDSRFAETARELAVHAARHAGQTDERAREFGAEVERILRRHLDGGAGTAPIPMIVRRTTGPVEVVIHGRAVTLDP